MQGHNQLQALCCRLSEHLCMQARGVSVPGPLAKRCPCANLALFDLMLAFFTKGWRQVVGYIKRQE